MLTLRNAMVNTGIQMRFELLIMPEKIVRIKAEDQLPGEAI
jgi:hypothetical protein